MSAPVGRGSHPALPCGFGAALFRNVGLELQRVKLQLALATKAVLLQEQFLAHHPRIMRSAAPSLLKRKFGFLQIKFLQVD